MVGGDLILLRGKLILLRGYMAIAALGELALRHRPDGSLVRIVLTIIAVLGIPRLARRRRVIAARIDSGAVRGDAGCSITCA